MQTGDFVFNLFVTFYIQKGKGISELGQSNLSFDINEKCNQSKHLQVPIQKRTNKKID